MFPVNADEYKIIDHLPAIPVKVELGYDPQLSNLIANLDPTIPWGKRKEAAEQLGNLGNTNAVLALTEALPTDPFWMVRTAIIQALEKIGDRTAIPTLKLVAKTDQFRVVRAYAAKAVASLS